MLKDSVLFKSLQAIQLTFSISTKDVCSKTCVKRTLKNRQNKDLNGEWEHSAILSTFIRLRVIWLENRFTRYMIVKRYIKVGYNLDVMRQSACLVLNPITAYSFGFLFKCTTVGQASDSMTALT